MKHVLVLGAGRVAGPCVQYLLRDPEVSVTVVDLNGDNFDRVLKGNPRGRGLVRDVATELPAILVEVEPDIVINLLPAALMAPAAAACVEAGIHYVNPSYIKDDMRALDGKAKEKGLVLLCELGLDPGIDHMSAAKTIHEIHQGGGKIRSFHSWCGALPAREANDNPLGYKLSWAPSGLIGASKREARILQDGQVVIWPDGETFRKASLIEIAGCGWFEQYANADSLPYIEHYGMPEVKTVYRGTLRFPGWSEMICAMQDLHLFDLDERDFRGLTFAGLTGQLVGAAAGDDVDEALRKFLGLAPYSSVYMKLRWLGLLDERPIPMEKGSLRDVVSFLYGEKLVFAPGERDLVVMEHRYVIEKADGSVVERRSTLVDYGIPDGDTSIARTTGIPPAIGALLILRGGFNVPGVHAPVLPEVYEPALKLLEEEGVRFIESERPLA
ncbi:MAG: saccharopine dehydrogenase NADP-binding domain-containing protein [Synergistaceae bacterium]|nr:saccharopine dehydrogenase NADP-binding domain-containing protein [Synergistaceae bacterium]